MRCKKILKWSLLIVSLVLLTSCSNLKSWWSFNQKIEPVKMPKILFLYTFDFSSDDYYVMSYIDEDGNIYTTSPNKLLRIVDMYENLELQEDEITGQVDKEKLQEMYQLFLRVPTESGETNNLTRFSYGLDVEMGKHKWRGLRYNEKEELEVIHLDAAGKSGYRNEDEGAQKISKWLREVFDRVRHYG